MTEPITAQAPPALAVAGRPDPGPATGGSGARTRAADPRNPITGDRHELHPAHPPPRRRPGRAGRRPAGLRRGRARRARLDRCGASPALVGGPAPAAGLEHAPGEAVAMLTGRARNGIALGAALPAAP